MQHFPVINLRIFTSESHLRSYVEALKQLQIKPRKNSEAPAGFEPITYAIPVRCRLYQLSYGASPEAGQVRVQFINTRYMKKMT